MTLDITFLKTSSFEFTGDQSAPRTFYYLHALLDGTEYCRLSLDPSCVKDFDDISAGDIITIEFSLSSKGKVLVKGVKL